MSKKQKPVEAPRPQKRNTKSIAAVAGTVLLIIALIAVLTYKPSNRPAPIAPTPTTTTQTGAYEFVKQGEVRFQTAKQDFISAIDVELAQDEPKRQLGLMYRDTLAENQGMLFIFEGDEERAFWMKNTVLPLDMIFVNSKDEIVTIHKNTTPYSEQSYASSKPSQFVIEVNAGYADRHKISVGDHIVWNRF
jgi:uncharacterized membrane protein (UPF0127 family)